MPVLQVSVVDVLAGVLLSVRLAIVLFLTPLMGGSGVPAQVKVMALFALCLWLVLALHPALPDAGHLLQSLPALLLAILAEVWWGSLLGFGLSCAFAAFMAGGRMLELQMGLGVATLFDPATRSQQPILGSLLQMAGVAGFLAIDGHHMVLRALLASLDAVPLGSAPFTVPPLAVLAQFGLMFSLGLMLVGAAIVGVLLVDVGMSVLSRVLPQANVFLLSVPLKVVAGLAILALSLPWLAPTLSHVHLSVFHYWDALLAK